MRVKENQKSNHKRDTLRLPKKPAKTRFNHQMMLEKNVGRPITIFDRDGNPLTGTLLGSDAFTITLEPAENSANFEGEVTTFFKSHISAFQF